MAKLTPTWRHPRHSPGSTSNATTHAEITKQKAANCARLLSQLQSIRFMSPRGMASDTARSGRRQGLTCLHPFIRADRIVGAGQVGQHESIEAGRLLGLALTAIDIAERLQQLSERVRF